MKIRRDRTKMGLSGMNGVGVVWYRGILSTLVFIRLIPWFPIIISWRRKVQPVTPVTPVPPVPPEERLEWD